jgi:anthranilate synthase component 1
MAKRPATESVPSLAAVRRLARDYNVIPVTRTLLADLETPVSAYLKIARAFPPESGAMPASAGRPSRRARNLRPAGMGTTPWSFLLESVEGGETVGRYSYLGAGPYLILRQRAGVVQEFRAGRWRQVAPAEAGGGMFDLARAEVGRRRLAPVPGAVPFMSGAVGYFGYDMVRMLERLPERARDDMGLDDALLMFFSRLLVFDHVRRQVTLVACVMRDAAGPLRGRAGSIEAEYRRVERELDRMEQALSLPPVLPRVQTGRGRLRASANMTRAQFEAGVRRAKRYIAAGDVFQVVLSQRLDIATRVSPFEVYRQLRRINPSPYMFFLQFDDFAVVGASPEMLVNVGGREIAYRPIAGTRPRAASEAEDRRLEQELLTDEKERAEHIMLVDLGRNDVGRVAEYGSVAVSKLMFVEKYSHVQHLVSSIRGTLKPGADMFDAFASCFPAGTLTGAPKVRAMEIIEELEPTRRGIYGGAVLYLDFSGNLNSCIAIRTLVIKKNRAYLQAGAGIVADSVPAREYEESLNKARAVMRAIEAAQAGA